MLVKESTICGKLSTAIWSHGSVQMLIVDRWNYRSQIVRMHLENLADLFDLNSVLRVYEISLYGPSKFKDELFNFFNGLNLHPLYLYLLYFSSF